MKVILHISPGPISVNDTFRTCGSISTCPTSQLEKEREREYKWVKVADANPQNGWLNLQNMQIVSDHWRPVLIYTPAQRKKRFHGIVLSWSFGNLPSSSQFNIINKVD